MLFTSGPRDVQAEPIAGDAARAEDIAEAMDGAWTGRSAGACKESGGSHDGDGPAGGGFGYLLAPAAAPRPDPEAPRRLDALAVAMAEVECAQDEAMSDLPLAMQQLLRFVANDLAAPAWRTQQAGLDADAAAAPLPRETVETQLANLKSGGLRLESLYDCDLLPGPLGDKLRRLMREPGANARLRLDRAWPDGRRGAALPRDRGADLLRLGRLIGDDPDACVTEAELSALPPALRARVMQGEAPNRALAVTGEGRNDKSLPQSQFHVALIRVHNRAVDLLADEAGRAPESLFDDSRRLLRLHLQWLVLHRLLPRICDPVALGRVRRACAPIYAEFRADLAGAAVPGGPLPAPLEFVFAAGRLHATMIPGACELNAVHGAPGGAPAPLALMARPPAGLGRPERLPDSLVLDWARWTRPDGPGRARCIDTFLAPTGDADAAPAMLGFARAALRRGWALSLPSGQSAAAAVNAVYEDLVRPLREAELTAGHTGEAVRDGLAEETPLWFYLLKEAEVQHGGRRLGQLGSVLVAETLIGAMVQDRDSVWHARGRSGGPWSPDQGLTLPGGPIEDLHDLMRAAELV